MIAASKQQDVTLQWREPLSVAADRKVEFAEARDEPLAFGVFGTGEKRHRQKREVLPTTWSVTRKIVLDSCAG
jgi:hypothetical protein